MMKKAAAIIFAAVIVIACICLAAPAWAKTPELPEFDEQAFAVRDARLLNMLNHSFVYDNDFDNTESVVNASMPALLNYAEDDFVSMGVVEQYIFDMYGIKAARLSEINVDYPAKEGYVYIIPRGFSVYRHTLKSVNVSEDGTVTVHTAVEIENHDSEPFDAECVARFVKNDASAYGYNILSADILCDEI